MPDQERVGKHEKVAGTDQNSATEHATEGEKKSDKQTKRSNMINMPIPSKVPSGRQDVVDEQGFILVKRKRRIKFSE